MKNYWLAAHQEKVQKRLLENINTQIEVSSGVWIVSQPENSYQFEFTTSGASGGNGCICLSYTIMME
jgi:hypothetical protein